MFDEDFLAQLPDSDAGETREWCDAVEEVARDSGPERARYLLNEVLFRAQKLGIGLPPLIQTPYINTIPPEEEPPHRGSDVLEKRIRRLVRWNAVAMVHRANERFAGLGGHLSTYASSASLYEMGFNHFFRGPKAKGGADFLFIQGHAAPGIYARAFLEGRLTEEHLDHFRRETSGKGLPSYPHPWLLPDFWQFPTVSMGLGPISAIYQARFNRYLHARGIKDTSEQRVWAFLGDGETDEPESLGALSLAARESLGNLIFVVNCNLQRLDGPVRGNGKIIQELERVFRGAGWHVIKVIWGPEWNDLLERDVDGRLVQRMNEITDGRFQKYSVESGAFIRQDFFGEALAHIVAHLTDEDLRKLRRGGHSFRKLFAAYEAATTHRDQPVAILCKTVKGWTLGDDFAGKNVTHQLKKMNERALKRFRDLLQLEIPDDRLHDAPYYRPPEDAPEIQYMRAQREALGGMMPCRGRAQVQVPIPPPDAFAEFFAATQGRTDVSTTMAFVRLLRVLLRDKGMGRHVVPIVPDEARTFGMDPLFREIGIYAPGGQLYDPVDSALFLNYHEAKDGQLLEEGITEAGSMASFTAAGTAHAHHGVPMVPFYVFYSMFGLQRTGDQAWAFGDARGRGFLLGATAGRTTLNGEGLQHEDGHSQLLANAYPNMCAYDPAFAYELAVIIREGLRRMLVADEDVYYYITLYNEDYAMPAMPQGAEEGILRGLYLYRPAAGARAQLWGSGPLLMAALDAQARLAEFGVPAAVWSVTSYQQLYRECRKVERMNRLHPHRRPEESHLSRVLRGHSGPVVTTSDWTSEVPSLLGRFLDRPLLPLGTDGYGRSDTREALRDHFEVDGRWMAYSTLVALWRLGEVTEEQVLAARDALGIRTAKSDPAVS
jgi:pyruvate dehydrogenase E1 component